MLRISSQPQWKRSQPLKSRLATSRRQRPPGVVTIRAVPTGERPLPGLFRAPPGCPDTFDWLPKVVRHREHFAR